MEITIAYWGYISFRVLSSACFWSDVGFGSAD